MLALLQRRRSPQVRKISEDEIRHYREHGVVYLPNLLDADWIKKMETAFAHEMFADPKDLNHIDVGEAARQLAQMDIELLTPSARSATGRFWIRTFNWRRFPSVAKLGCSPPLPEAIAT